MLKRDIKQYLLYVFLFIPLTFVSLEIGFSLLNKIRGIELPVKRVYKFDSINGWRGYAGKRSEKSIELIKGTENMHFSLDEHTLHETPFSVNSKTKDKNDGILISGNSFAAGWHPNVGLQNENTFYSKLEKSLRNDQFNIDVVNISFSGYSSWQEHIEIARYLNSAPIKNNLPKVKLLISLGAIQDFYNLIDLMRYKNDAFRKEYLNANGIMTKIDTIKYTQDFLNANEGSPISGFKIFIDSISAYLQKKSHSYYYLSNIYPFKKNPISFLKYQVKGIVGREKWEEFRGRKVFKQQYGLNFEQILEEKFLTSPSDYLVLRDYLISSVVRNIKATKGLIGDIPYIYVYSPTVFNSEVEGNILKKVIYSHNKLTLEDIQKLEKDFRDELLAKIKMIPGIRVIDYAGKANYKTWFTDFTHLNGNGHQKMYELLYSDIYNTIKTF
jgi:hypothetical protein